MHKLVPIGLLLSTLFLYGCSEQAVQVELATLKNAQNSFNVRQVKISGTLQTFATPRHFWIEDDARNRVALDNQSVSRFYSEEELIGLEGKVFEVAGEFRYQSDKGRSIRVATIELIGVE